MGSWYESVAARLAEKPFWEPQEGLVVWIGLRMPKQRQNGGHGPLQPGAMNEVEQAELRTSGLLGDRYSKEGGKRALTLVQFEHFPVLESLLGTGLREGSRIGSEGIHPSLLRRNLVIAGINVQSLKRARFAIGDTVLEGSSDCFPCRRMDETLGKSGYLAMRGHGGINTRVVQPGTISLGDRVRLLDAGPFGKYNAEEEVE